MYIYTDKFEFEPLKYSLSCGQCTNDGTLVAHALKNGPPEVVQVVIFFASVVMDMSHAV